MIAAWPPPLGVPGGEPPTVPMCPSLGYRCELSFPTGTMRLWDRPPSPWMAGCRVMDYPVHQVMFMFAPPPRVIREAQRAGLPGVFRRPVKGLREALERVKDLHDTA